MIRIGFHDNVSLFEDQCYWKRHYLTFIDEISYLLKKLGQLLDKILDENGLPDSMKVATGKKIERLDRSAKSGLKGNFQASCFS